MTGQGGIREGSDWTLEILSYEGGETLQEAAQKSCGCLIPDRIQGPAKRGSELPGLAEDILAHNRGLELDGLRVSFNPNHSRIAQNIFLWY